MDADDLAGLIAALKLGPVHLAGTSYGALAALTFALERPTQVRSLVLAEPPVLEWANQLAGGRELYAHFMDKVHRPAGRAFAAGRDDVRGERTDALHRMIAEHLAALAPQAKLIVIANAGHGSPRQNAPAFTDAVMTFLAALPRR